MGEAGCAFGVGRLALALGFPVRLAQGRLLNWASAQKVHLIVLGGPDINNWTHQNKPKADFTFVSTGIRNAAPRRGEPALYETLSDDATGELRVDYGMIWMFESLPGSRILVLAGRSSPGTAGIGDFFTDPDKMRAAFEKLKAAYPQPGFPANWQVLLKVNVREGIPVGSSFVTCRVHPPAGP